MIIIIMVVVMMMTVILLLLTLTLKANAFFPPVSFPDKVLDSRHLKLHTILHCQGNNYVNCFFAKAYNSYSQTHTQTLTRLLPLKTASAWKKTTSGANRGDKGLS